MINRYGLREFFDSVVISGEVGVKKPDPRIFSFALDKAGLNPAEVAYVGDTQEDMQAACSTGLIPILILRDPVALDYSPGGQLESNADVSDVHTIARLSDLTGLFNGS